MEIRSEGKIKRLEKHHGSVSSDSMEDLFFNAFDLNYENPNIGDEVSFFPKKNKRGSYEATNIDLLKKSQDIKKSHKRKFQFVDINDFRLAYESITEKLNYQLLKKKNFENSEDIEDEITYILGVLEELTNGVKPNISSIQIKDLNDYEPGNCKREDNEYWLKNFDIQNFGIRLIELGKVEPTKSIQKNYSIVWGEWRDKTKQIFLPDPDDKHIHLSFIEKDKKEQTTVYEEILPKARWKLRKIKQKNTTFYISSAPVKEIARFSYVPSLPPVMNVDDTAERILNTKVKPNQWQREVENNRVRKIEQFIQESENIVANTPMLYVNSPKHVKIIKDELVLSYESFLEKIEKGEYKDKYVDRIERKEKDEAGNAIYDEFRPLWLIDGQHRVKGIHRSNQNNIEIPIIVFPYDFGADETAKVFAEINTLQKKLDPLHELFMQHRFKIDHVSPTRKFRDYRKTELRIAERENWGSDWRHSRANNLSYEIAAMIASKGVLKNQIQFLPQNDKKSTFVSADQWVKHSRELFFSECYRYKGEIIEGTWITNPSAEEEEMDEVDFFYEEMNNYFKAWIEICNHKEWDKNKSESWTKELSKKKGLIQNRSYFIILLEIYNVVREKAEDLIINKYQKKILSKNDFKEALKVFKWVDWTDSELKNIYSGGGERGRRSLEAWMLDAVLNGESYDHKEIHCGREKNKSKPGKGISSHLGIPEIEITDGRDWPKKNQSLKVRSKRLYNARSEATWQVFDINDNTIAEKKTTCDKYVLDSYAEFELKHSREIDKISKLIIQVEWRNAHTQTGKYKKIITKT